MTIFLVQPDPGGRISGGFRYNDAMSTANAVQSVTSAAAHLSTALGQLRVSSNDVILADSLFLSRHALAPFLDVKRNSRCRLGVLLHAFPTFIERAQQRHQLLGALPLKPSTEELSLLSHLDLLVVPGPYIPRLLGDHPIRCVVCPPGRDAVTSESPSRASRSTDPVQVLSLANVTPAKGLSDGARALALHASKAFHWTIIGSLDADRRYVTEFQELLRTLGLAQRVTLSGQRPHREAQQRLAQSDLFLMPSYTENFPLVAREALASGVPVVGYDAGGVSDIVTHQHSGLLAPLLNEARLSEHLGQAIAEPDLRSRLAQGCRTAAHSWPTWTEAAAELTRLVSGPERGD